MDRTKKFLGALTGALVIILGGISLIGAGAENTRLAPEISGQAWINSQPLKLAELRGKVVLVEFWTFGCYNCRNVEPYIKAWHQKFADSGLTVIAIHSPEFSYERTQTEVQRYVREHAISYPVAIDNDFITWNRYKNHYWPALYLIDKRGVLRYSRFGEGGYNQTEQQITKLLDEPYNANRQGKIS